MNMKKRLTRGKGVAERIISDGRGAEENRDRSAPYVLPILHEPLAHVPLSNVSLLMS